MFNHADDLFAQMRHSEMLKEAEERRRFARAAIKQPSVFERAFTALRSAVAAQRVPVQKPDTAKRLVAE